MAVYPCVAESSSMESITVGLVCPTLHQFISLFYPLALRTEQWPMELDRVQTKCYTSVLFKKLTSK